MATTVGYSPMLAVLDAVEDRLSVAALRLAQGAQARTESARLQALARGRLALRQANRLVGRNLASLRKGEGLAGPDAGEPLADGDLQRELDWLGDGRT